jgi:hypothetical protein
MNITLSEVCGEWLKILLHSFFGVCAKLQRVTISFAMSVCLSVRMKPIGTNWLDFYQFDIWRFFENLSRKSNLHENLTKITSTLYKDLRTLMKTSAWILLRMRNGSNKQRKSKHAFYVQYTFSENSAVYEIMWKNMVQPDGTNLQYNFA